MPSQYGIFGDYASWEDAVMASSGYDSRIILEKVKTSLLKVKNGEAVYERDSALFDQVEYAWPLLAGLMWVAAQSGGRLNVLDYGGSLGTTYFQNRWFLKDLSEVRWNIVEQPHYVETGKRYFEDDELRFYYDIEACLSETSPRVIIFSGVLPYLEKPYGVLEQALHLTFDVIIVDRTSCWRGKSDRLGVQKVPPHIFEAGYPIWIFSLDKFRDFFARHEIVAEFPGFADDGASYGCDFMGFIIKVSKEDRCGQV